MPLGQLLLVLHHTELHTMIHTLLFLASCIIELHSWRTWREGKKSPEAISTFRLPSFGVVAEYEVSCKDAEGQKLHTSPPIYLTTSMTKVRPFLGIRIKRVTVPTDQFLFVPGSSPPFPFLYDTDKRLLKWPVMWHAWPSPWQPAYINFIDETLCNTNTPPFSAILLHHVQQGRRFVPAKQHRTLSFLKWKKNWSSFLLIWRFRLPMAFFHFPHLSPPQPWTQSNLAAKKNSLSRENFPVLCRRASQAGLLLLLPLAIAPASFSFKNLILSAMAPELTWPNPLCKQTSFLKGIFLLRAFPRVLMDWLAGFLSLERTTKSSFFNGGM